MKIDVCLTATDTKSNYIKHIPTFIHTWKRLNIIPHILLIHTHIPDEYKKYSEYITLFNHLDYDKLKTINTAFIAQIIRIYYPALLSNKNVIISDIDIVPISYNFFVKNVNKYADDMFINYRRYNGQLNICYNLANTKTWHSIFEVNNIDDIVEMIYTNYNQEYNGLKNCPGWFVDQEILTSKVSGKIDSSRVVFMDKIHKLRRIDKRERVAILKNIEEILNNINNYDDFHITSKTPIYVKLSDTIIDKILETPLD